MVASARKRVVMIIARRNFRDEELQQPKAILERAGIEVSVASSALDQARGMLGAVAKPDLLLTDVCAAEPDAARFFRWSASVPASIARR